MPFVQSVAPRTTPCLLIDWNMFVLLLHICRDYSLCQSWLKAQFIWLRSCDNNALLPQLHKRTSDVQQGSSHWASSSSSIVPRNLGYFTSRCQNRKTCVCVENNLHTHACIAYIYTHMCVSMLESVSSNYGDSGTRNIVHCLRPSEYSSILLSHLSMLHQLHHQEKIWLPGCLESRIEVHDHSAVTVLHNTLTATAVQ